MRTTLDLPDSLLAQLKAQVACDRVTLKQLLSSYGEQGLSAAPSRAELKRSAATLPRLEGSLAIEDYQVQQRRLV
jgi:hypothetical protein